MARRRVESDRRRATLTCGEVATFLARRDVCRSPKDLLYGSSS